MPDIKARRMLQIKFPTWLVIAVQLVIMQTPSLPHSIHISYAHADQRGDALHVHVTYFKDDFFSAMHAWKSSAPAGDAEWTAKKLAYLQSVWNVAVNGVSLPLAIASSTEDGQSLSFELDFRGIAPHENIFVSHRALFDLYGDESNLLTIHTTSSDENFVLTKGRPECTLML